MEKQKVFISGPISSRPDTYREDFALASELVERAGFIPILPSVLPLGMEQGDYMKITLAMLETSDMVLLLDGWTGSEGAQLEAAYAEYIKKPCVEMGRFREKYLTPEPELPKMPASRVERMFGPREDWPNKAEPIVERDKPDGYKGFLLIRCPNCGDVRGFCAKDYVTDTMCRNCGTDIHLKDLIPAHVNCEKCGSHFKYRTNIDIQEPVPFSCLECDAPVDLQLNPRGTAVTTMRDFKRGVPMMPGTSERQSHTGS